MLINHLALIWFDFSDFKCNYFCPDDFKAVKRVIFPQIYVKMKTWGHGMDR